MTSQVGVLPGSNASNTIGGIPLFACTRCNSRHPFEELSQGHQLCKECRGTFITVKCTYCRTEFQQESKSSISSICKKCEQLVKLHGKPSACEYCNIIAAFIGTKCQRCTNSEKKYGPPMTCEQCKQKCAFDRKDPESSKKVDGKSLCWLCTLAYKRTLAKAKQNHSSMGHGSFPSSSHRSSNHTKTSSSSSRHNNLTTSGNNHQNSYRQHSSSTITASTINSSNSSAKKPRLDGIINKTSNGSLSATLPVTSSSSLTTDSRFNDTTSDNVLVVTQLKDQIATLNRRLQQKDKDLLEKDKQVRIIHRGP